MSVRIDGFAEKLDFASWLDRSVQRDARIETLIHKSIHANGRSIGDCPKWPPFLFFGVPFFLHPFAFVNALHGWTVADTVKQKPGLIVGCWRD